MKQLLTLMCLALLMGCTLTPLTEEEQYAREDARIVRREACWKFVAGCQACRTCSLMETRRMGRASRRVKHYRTVDDLPKHANRTDFQCVATGAVLRELKRLGY